MTLWDKLRDELDRAGRAAQGALDEGRLRLDAMRARQAADKAAQVIGYAVYRARQEGKELEPETYARLSSALAGREADAKRFEERLKEITERRAKRQRTGQKAAADASAASTTAEPPRAEGGAAGPSAPADMPSAPEAGAPPATP